MPTNRDPLKYKGRYRIPSARWAVWDYGSNAAYFITICTDRRINYFGTIRDGKMIHTPIGLAANDCWYAIPDHFPFVILDAFVVMPNHMHGILVIDKPDQPVETQDIASRSADTTEYETQNPTPLSADTTGHETQNPAPLSADTTEYETQNFAPLSADATGYETQNPAPLSADITEHETQNPAPLSADAIGYETQNFASLPSPSRFGPQSRNLGSIVRGYKIGVTKYANQHELPFKWQPRYHDRVIRNYAEYERIRRYIDNNIANWRNDTLYR